VTVGGVGKHKTIDQAFITLNNAVRHRTIHQTTRSLKSALGKLGSTDSSVTEPVLLGFGSKLLENRGPIVVVLALVRKKVGHPDAAVGAN
jgi:hypothetical protein